MWQMIHLVGMQCWDSNSQPSGSLCCLQVFLKNRPSPASFSFIFVFSNKHYNSHNQYMWKMLCLSSMWCRYSNPRSSEHGYPPITTRPGLPPCLHVQSVRRIDVPCRDVDYSLQGRMKVGWLNFLCPSHENENDDDISSLHPLRG